MDLTACTLTLRGSSIIRISTRHYSRRSDARSGVCVCLCAFACDCVCLCVFVFFGSKKVKKIKGNLLLYCPDKDEFAGVKAIR